jgi:hypothetical protein
MTALNMMVQEIEHNPEHFEEGLKAMLAEKRKALYRFLWDEAETQGMGGMKKGNEVSNL